MPEIVIDCRIKRQLQGSTTIIWHWKEDL